MLMLLSMKKDVDFLAYYDKGKFCGITYSVENEHMLYVMYLAVNDKIRGKGFGTAILDKMKEKCKGKPIALEAEFPSEDSVNLSQREKRLKFYRKNGFSDTSFILSSGGEKYMILCDTDKFTIDDYTHILKSLSYGLYKPKIENEANTL